MSEFKFNPCVLDLNSIFPDMRGRVFREQIEEYQRQDCIRYATKMFWDKNEVVDYDKIIRMALYQFIDKHLTEEDLEAIKDIKKAKELKVEEDRIAKKPAYSWEIKNNKGDK